MTRSPSAGLALVVASALACSGSEVTPQPPTAGPDSTVASASATASAPELGGAAATASTPERVTSASSSVASAAAPAGPCPEDMVDVRLACIDRFEAPNVRGEKPLRMRSVADGEAWCKERGKRLCNEDEWVRACEGPKGKPFPYGTKHDPTACNESGKFISPNWKALGGWPSTGATAEVDRLDQSAVSGAHPRCVSDDGVFDLTGNVAEWVVRTRENETNYSHVVKGCFWGRCFRPPHTPSCEYVNFAHPSGFRSYEMGIRCCRDRART